MRALRHDFAVSLDCDLFAVKLQSREQRRDLQRLLEAMRLAIHSHLNHKANDTSQAV
jgi:hypothetical protein